MTIRDTPTATLASARSAEHPHRGRMTYGARLAYAAIGAFNQVQLLELEGQLQASWADFELTPREPVDLAHYRACWATYTPEAIA